MQGYRNAKERSGARAFVEAEWLRFSNRLEKNTDKK